MNIINKFAHCDKLTRESYFDFKMYLPDDILVKVDRASMANSLETRAPLLDYRLAELAFSISPNLKVRNQTGKYILKQATKDILPERILNKKKQGFAVPLKRWFKDDLSTFIKDILLDQRTANRQYFAQPEIESIIRLHTEGTRDYSSWLWRLTVLELWHRKYYD